LIVAAALAIGERGEVREGGFLGLVGGCSSSSRAPTAAE
jgi:hypothetical protein